MSAVGPGDRARVSVRVAVPRDECFRIFTEEIDAWWRRGARFRVGGKHRGIVCLEPRVGGRLYESFDVGGEQKIFETGEVLVFDPPSRLVFSWRGSNFAPGKETRVEVVFEEGASGTLVTVVHEGWAGLRPDHPARHGMEPAPFVRTIGLWWSDLLSALREHGERDA